MKNNLSDLQPDLHRSAFSNHPPAGGFTFACPVCLHALEWAAADEQRCPKDGLAYRQREGIWRFLPPDREDAYRQFIVEYETVRQAEGRGMPDPAYYRALPFADLSGRLSRDWEIRARSWRALADRVLKPLEEERRRPLKALDLGAGNAWLSYRLAERGHMVAGVDLLVNAFDGLGATVYYDALIVPVQAEFDHLPFTSRQVDLVVYNASFHYSTDYAATLKEACRVLSPDGRVIILDTPVYRNATSGDQMVREREAHFEKQYGFRSNSVPSENYLTDQRLEMLAGQLNITWQIIAPFYGFRWALRPWKARLLGKREPARFLILAGSSLDLTGFRATV